MADSQPSLTHITCEIVCIPIATFRTRNITYICKYWHDLNCFMCYLLPKFDTSQCIYSDACAVNYGCNAGGICQYKANSEQNDWSMVAGR
jgi:hypothetical protein